MLLKANALVALRAVLALLFPFFFRLNDAPALWWSLGLLAVMGLTDVFDGRVARKTGTTSRVGELLDSMADGLARLTALIVFVANDLLPLWMVLVLVWRDLISWSLRFMDLGMGQDEVHKRLSGKVNGAAQSLLVGGVVVILLAAALSRTWPLMNLIWWLGLAASGTALWSTVDLLRTHWLTIQRFLGLAKA
ncbi:CDP-alcohol phosphatidyltransferase family protein [Deinococcus sp.]|uniref:CDP-alcohol phosphatidyltransferase family protein n=1 Tax=Deinococcus sp. TaxID=47478 RepID=UPI0025E71092|nr:CDP-alcohol phosphatidyltransferase family protein [Deinococcus sp.]